MKLHFGLLILAFVNPVAAADPPTPFPEFTGGRLYVAGVPDVYGAVTTTIAETERTSPQTYYVVVVRTSGSGTQATRNYTDALYQEWVTQAAERKLTFDPERSVLIVLALDNRQLSIHAGSRLLSEYGLTGQKIDSEIVAPSFIPFAKTGNYADGLTALIPKVEAWVAAQAAELARKRDLAASQKTKVSQAPAAPAGNTVPESATSLPSPNPLQPSEKSSSESPPATGAALSSGGEAADPGVGIVVAGEQQHAVVSPRPLTPRTAGGPPVAFFFGGGLLAITLLVVGVLRALHVRRRRLAGEQLAAFKQRVIELSDSLDALRERHKLLPSSIAAFQLPMTGETLSLYNAVSASLDRFREEWLKLMDAWDRAEKSIQSEQALSTKRCKEAQRILTAAGVADALRGLTEQCSSPLDRLAHGHARAAKDLATIDAESAQLNQQCESMQAAGLAISPYQADREAVATLIARVPEILPADPIGAQTALDQARQQFGALFRRTESILEQSRAARDADQALLRVAELAIQQRAAGLLLREAGADPDPLLAEARMQYQAVLEHLNAGDAESAKGCLQQVTGLADRAARGIDAHVSARASCGIQLPARQAELQRLKTVARQSHTSRSRLEQEFAADSWRGVAANLHEGTERIDTLASLIEKARQATDPGVQQFLAAASLLEQVETEQKQSVALFEAIDHRLQELTNLRTQCQSKLAEGRSLAARTGELLLANTADRPRSNQRYQAARQTLEQIAGEAASPRPDWTKIEGRLREALADLAKAEQFAREDIQLASQAESEIAETEHELRRAGAWFHLGCSADLSAAESLLAQARTSLRAQAYEDAIQLANRAEQAARDARAAAANRAAARQAELDEECRRKEAESRAQTLAGVAAVAAVAAVAVPVVAAIASSGIGDVPRSPPIDPPPPPEPAPGSGFRGTGPSVEPPTSSSTWPSETSQSSW